MADTEGLEVLQSIKGQQIVAVTVTEEGMHIDLADGRTLMLVGTFAVALLAPRDMVFH